MAIETAMEGTPYAVCSGAAPNHQRLVGLNLGRGFAKAMRERLGGPEGCTHLRELLLRHGADVNAITSDGGTALYNARTATHS